MDFDFIEGLTEEQIKNYYEEIMESSENNFISGVMWEVKCSNGQYGFYFNPSGGEQVGYGGYGADTAEGWSMYEHCRGGYGYRRVVATTNATHFVFWKVECSDGRVGFYVNPNANFYVERVGYGGYGVDTAEGWSMYEHCRGGYGYRRVVFTR